MRVTKDAEGDRIEAGLAGYGQLLERRLIALLRLHYEIYVHALHICIVGHVTGEGTTDCMAL